MSRFHDRLQAGEPAIGTIVLTTGPEWVDLMAHVGFDFLCIDQMVTAIDWAEAANMVRAAKQFGASPWMRLQAYPWAGAREAESLTMANILRAISIGAEGVTVSVDTPEAARALLHASDNRHRRIWIMGGEDSVPFGLRGQLGAEPEPLIFPLIESLGAVERMDEFFDIDGLETVFFGLGDLTRLLEAPTMHDAVVLNMIERAVAAAEKAGKYISVTSGYVDNPTPAEITRTVKLFWDMGVKVIWVPYPTYLMQDFYRRMLGGLQSIRPVVSGAGAV